MVLKHPRHWSSHMPFILSLLFLSVSRLQKGIPAALIKGRKNIYLEEYWRRQCQQRKFLRSLGEHAFSISCRTTWWSKSAIQSRGWSLQEHLPFTLFMYLEKKESHREHLAFYEMHSCRRWWDVRSSSSYSFGMFFIDWRLTSRHQRE